MKANTKTRLNPAENEPQTGMPTKKQIGHKHGKDHPHEPPVSREQTDHTKNTASMHGLNEDRLDSNDREPLN